MQLVMCSVYDHKAGVYTHPQYFRSNAEAIRAFADAVNSEKGVFSAHPADYSFHKLGMFDDSTGQIVADVVPLVTGPECIART